MSKTPTGFFGRSASLLSMATKVAAKELSGRVLKSDAAEKLHRQMEQAKIIAEHLGRLKGAAMKAGQLLSLDSSEFLPPEAVEILSRLQDRAQAEPFSKMENVLRRELGDRMNQITDLSPEPRASASIGQIHFGRIEGEPVAVKIQYPGVADAIDSDLAILKSLSEALIRLSGKKIKMDETFAELGQVLRRETDYRIELNNLTRYRELLASSSQYIVPRAFPEFSTERVLTMSWEDGLPLKDWLSLNPSVEDRRMIAVAMLELFCLEFADWGFVQTDPNFANFLVRRHPLRLVCLDFGAALEYDHEFRAGYAQLLSRLRDGSDDEIFNAAVDFGILDPREPEEARRRFADMIKISVEPFNPDRQPFAFNDADFEKRSTEANVKFSRSLVYSPPPRKLIFLHRKLGGIFKFVKRLGVTLDLTPYWKRMTGA